MSDNIYKVLMGDNAPFSGLANKNYFDRTLRGEIIKVHYNLFEQNKKDGQFEFQQFGYRSIDIRWIEAKPHISCNVRIPEIVSMQGYGLNYLPSVGDIVYASFDSKNYPIIQNIYSRCAAFEHGILSNETQLPELNNYGDPLIDTAIKKEIRPTPIRYIVPGEISLTSLNLNNELYFDKYGTAKLIARVPNLTNETGEQCGDRLWEISVGKDIYNEGTNTLKQSSFGNNVQFQILGHQNDCKVDFDNAGNIEINTNNCNIQVDRDGVITATIKNGEQIKITSSGIFLGNGTMQQAVWGNKLQDLLIELINAYNSHTHTGNLGFPTDSPKIIVKMQDILSETVEVK